MKSGKKLSKEQLKERAVRFYDRYGYELSQIAKLLDIRLSQLALAYTIDNNLPPESIRVSTRVKTLSSFLKKLEKKDWPQFYYPVEVAQDLIGARVTCWFVDDCTELKKLISSSNHIHVEEEEDYISNPKKSGYRSIHLAASVNYDSVRRNQAGEIEIDSEDMLCEIQIRSKLQDAWGDVTHEFHYKAKLAGVDNSFYETTLSEISDRLASEDRSLMRLRDAYQELADDKAVEGTREGFKDH